MREENHRSREGNDILSVAAFTHGACFLDYGHSSGPAGEPSFMGKKYAMSMGFLFTSLL